MSVEALVAAIAAPLLTHVGAAISEGFTGAAALEEAIERLRRSSAGESIDEATRAVLARHRQRILGHTVTCPRCGIDVQPEAPPRPPVPVAAEALDELRRLAPKLLKDAGHEERAALRALLGEFPR